MIRVIIVDDSIFFRKIISDIMVSIENVEVVATASSGNIALSKVQQLMPDLVTMDVEMPGMDGIKTLQEVKDIHPDAHVVMISSKTASSAQHTIEALSRGALEFIEKPDGSSGDSNELDFERALKNIVRLVEMRRYLGATASRPVTAPSRPSFTPRQVEIIAIGISTGGPASLPAVLSELPDNFSVPIVIVQHIPPTFVGALVDSLNQKCVIKIQEAKPDMSLEKGTVYLAPGGRQMKLTKRIGQEDPVIAITDDPAENFCKPSVDYLFRSVADLYGQRALGVIMTGMGRDGTEGAKVMKDQGASIIAQDEATSIVYGMPMEAAKAGVVDLVLPLDQIAAELKRQI